MGHLPQPLHRFRLPELQPDPPPERAGQRRAGPHPVRREQVGTGDRSEKIRTYNFPQSRVTDHRIKLTTHALEGFLDGDIGEMIDALRSFDAAERLKKSE
ncbi:MAG: hypothetical protein IKK94_06725 [Clostridia bacterium]|nr:hypothetical protein [Clostridia bacterium]